MIATTTTETNATAARLLRRAALAVSTLSMSAERDDTRHTENMELAAACDRTADALEASTLAAANARFAAAVDEFRAAAAS